MAQTAIMEPVPGTGTDDRARLTQPCIPHNGDRQSLPPRQQNIHENVPHATPSEQSDDSQPRHGRDAHTGYNLSVDKVIQGVPESIEHSRCSIREPQSIDMNALREEIKEMISATIKEKLRSDADSVTTVSQSILALDTNAQYWSNLSNKAARHSRRALKLQLKLAEEKVNTLLHKEAPEEVLLEAAWEARTIHFQLDQNRQLREAGLMPEQQVRFSADTGRNVTSPSRNYGVNPINEVHIPRPEVDAPFGRQGTPALSISAQLAGAVVNMTSEYSGIQQMVRQAIQNASHEEEPEKSFLAKAGVKMGNPPTYSSECNLKKFENWVASKVQLQFLGQCLTDEAQEWLYQQVEWFDREIKHWDLESVMMGLQKWFMPTLSLNKVAVNYDHIMQGSMTMQQLHQELTKLAKQMIELPDAYSYRRSNPIRTAVKAKNTVVCFNCNQPDHIQPNCPFPDKDRRVTGARIEEVILEENEGQIEEFDEYVPHPEEQQEYEDQPEEDDQQYCFNDEEYETRSIDNEVTLWN
ncbi:hypothetical protein M422DRAFT_240665 [Sphaerobolus stellatus SS14]|nr:hypothetical protein M422DRAFT_240665 [Sphaerobolus stellatus SS14]